MPCLFLKRKVSPQRKVSPKRKTRVKRALTSTSKALDFK